MHLMPVPRGNEGFLQLETGKLNPVNKGLAQLRTVKQCTHPAGSDTTMSHGRVEFALCGGVRVKCLIHTS